jgi:hypothetical protein
MNRSESFVLFLTCLLIIGWLVTFALAKGVDGVIFGSGVGGLCATAGYVAKSLKRSSRKAKRK